MPPDPPPARSRRVVVVGVAGAGKTTLATALAVRLGVPHVEMDALFWQPGWTKPVAEDFHARIREAAHAPGWVIDGNYGAAVRDLVWTAADTVVWLDLSRREVMPQLGWRTLRRIVSGTELFNGNRERPLRDQLSRDPQRSILRWSWRTHPDTREEYAALMHDPAYAGTRFVRLRSRAEIREYLRTTCPPG